MKKKSSTDVQTAPTFATPSLMRRFAAMVYDSLLLMAISILYGFVMTGINIAINGAPDAGERVSWGNFGIVVFVGWVFTVCFFFCYFWRKSGQTLGMKTWRMKILDSETMQLPSILQCVVRCCCAPFSLLLFGVGYWLMYLTPDRQTLHDKLSKTGTFLLAKDKK